MRRSLPVIQERVRAAIASAPDAVAAAHRELDAEIARFFARSPELAAACSAGCSYCCHVHADATRGEIVGIARHLEQTRADLAAFIDRLAAHVAVVGAMTHDERWRARIPCALLGEDGRCTIYEVRPFRCRAFHSASADTCRDAYHGGDDDPVTIHLLDRVTDAVERGHDEALGDAAATVLLEPALLAELRS